MLAEPDGRDLGMTVDLLSGSPFKDFFIPGLFLLTVNGLFNLAASVLSFCRYRYSYLPGIGLGTALIIWVSVQVYSVGLTHFLQPANFIIGITEIILSIMINRSVIQKENNSRLLIRFGENIYCKSWINSAIILFTGGIASTVQ